MSDTNTNINTNDDAIKNKNKKNKHKKEPNIGSFLLYYAIGILGIILFILFGTMWLYISKLCASKNIPTKVNYEPYSCATDPSFGHDVDATNPSIYTPMTVPMNSVQKLGLKGLAFWDIIGKWQQTATFNSDEIIASFDDTFIDELRNKARIKGTGPGSATGWDKYLSIVLNNVVASGFNLYSKFSFPNINESFSIFLYGLLGLILFPLFWMLNGIMSFYYHIRAALKTEADVEDKINENGANMFDGSPLEWSDEPWSLWSNVGKGVGRFFILIILLSLIHI
jgi:hypothetical protein